jgi:hypothetical protein
LAFAEIAGMPKRHATIAWVCAVQYGAAGLGAAWGLGAAHHVPYTGISGSLFGSLGVILLGVQWLHFIASRRFRIASPVASWVCVALACYALALMRAEPFLWYYGDITFVTGVLLLLPFLFGMSPLVRARAWLGVVGSILFFAQSLAMLTHNGSCRSGGSGFFTGWVS